MRKTYVWFSPLGEKNQAAIEARTIMTRPMMMLQLVGNVVSTFA